SAAGAPARARRRPPPGRATSRGAGGAPRAARTCTRGRRGRGRPRAPRRRAIEGFALALLLHEGHVGPLAARGLARELEDLQRAHDLVADGDRVALDLRLGEDLLAVVRDVDVLGDDPGEERLDPRQVLLAVALERER